MWRHLLRVPVPAAVTYILSRGKRRFVTRPQVRSLIQTQTQTHWTLAVAGVVHVAMSANVSQEDRCLLALAQCDELFGLGKYKESISVLEEFRDTDNAEVLWRLCRSIYNLSKYEKNSKLKKQLVGEAFALIERAMSLNDAHHAVHKWYAVVLDSKSDLDGIKSRISTLETFKKHLLRAIELNPRDATSIYILGQFCYNIADMPWYQRKIASTFFATPPESTFEEALTYFKRAEEIEPNFYSFNLLMLGKTYLKLQQVETARYWLTCASDYVVRTEDDRKAREEANELLRKTPAPKS